MSELSPALTEALTDLQHSLSASAVRLLRNKGGKLFCDEAEERVLFVARQPADIVERHVQFGLPPGLPAIVPVVELLLLLPLPLPTPHVPVPIPPPSVILPEPVPVLVLHVREAQDGIACFQT